MPADWLRICVTGCRNGLLCRLDKTMLGHITNISWVKAEIDKNFYSAPLKSIYWQEVRYLELKHA